MLSTPELITAAMAILAIVLTLITILIQRSHNVKSVKPIANIDLSDYEGIIAVDINNNGVGPLIIDEVIVSDGDDSTDNLLDMMPALNYEASWDDFTKNLKGRAIPANGKIKLLQLSGDTNSSWFITNREMIRETLSKLTITVEYSDIYGRKMPKEHKPLDWFDRFTFIIGQVKNQPKNN